MKNNDFRELLNETVYSETLSNNLKLFYMPKPGFTKKYAVFATDFGSNDLEFFSPHTSEKIRVNEGIAHFLEHKMFEQKDGTDAFAKFSQLGADANAFTNFDMTAYLFSTTENFYEALEHLISYVQEPYFTEENVEKEKGIIAQEIKMYQDNPAWVLFFNALRAMYVSHHTRIDIAGTVESIYEITPEELYTCYNTFYSPSNMAIFVVGDLDWEQIRSVVKKTVKDTNEFEGRIRRIEPEEPQHIAEKEVIRSFPISIPSFMLGVKEHLSRRLEGEEMAHKMITTGIVMDLLFRKGSRLHEELYRENLIFGSLDCEFNSGSTYAYSLISAESRDVKEVVRRIKLEIERAKKEGFSKEDFERNKKVRIGQYISSFDSIEGLANSYISHYFQGIDIMEYGEYLNRVTMQDCIDRLNEHFREENMVLSIVQPTNDGETDRH